MTLLDNINEALQSIKGSILRSLLTLLIIAVGITCLVGILTALDNILFSMSSNFNRLGANSFSIRPASTEIQASAGGRTMKQSDPITYEQAMRFKEAYKFSGTNVTVDASCENNATVKFREKESNPNVMVLGVDENHTQVLAYELEEGRSFNASEINSMNYRAVIGSEIVKLLFDGNPSKALGAEIVINTDRYRVIGVLKSKGSSSGGNNDRRVLIPLLTAKAKYGFATKNYNISVGVTTDVEIEQALEVATGIMRNIRRLSAYDKNDFEIRKSDSILATLKDMTSTLRLATVIIAMLTLLGAAIGLMNIMLVSVTERTREIGVRKALGATRQNIMIQFLTEAIVICLMGGIVGIILGILLGLFVTIIIKGAFVIPWAWMALGMFVCIFVGVVSGLYPALKASRLDPIESLRYE
jgi:putative ABC transport system permease protein